MKLVVLSLQPSEFDFEMQHGVIKVWSDASRDALIADTPGDSHEFFVDMHRCHTVN
jgi:hypothetical protein